MVVFSLYVGPMINWLISMVYPLFAQCLLGSSPEDDVYTGKEVAFAIHERYNGKIINGNI